MLKLNSKAVRVTALATAAAFALLPMAGAAAVTPSANASAYGAQVDLLNGTVHVGPLAQSTFPTGSNETAVPINLPTIADVAGIFANTSGDSSAGTSSATAGTAALGVLGTVLTGYAISADVISATCSATGSDFTGSATVANLKVGTNSIVNATFTTQQNALDIPGVASVIIGEHIANQDGSTTINALHIHLLGGANAGDIILGHVTCGPNVAPLAVSAFSFQDLPIVLGGIALIVLIGFGIRTGIRRLGSAA
jgi:hypothetical protein